MTDDPTMVTDPAERERIAERMVSLREMVDEGEIGRAEFNREYRALSRQLLGDKAWNASRRALRGQR